MPHSHFTFYFQTAWFLLFFANSGHFVCGRSLQTGDDQRTMPVFNLWHPDTGKKLVVNKDGLLVVYRSADHTSFLQFCSDDTTKICKLVDNVETKLGFDTQHEIAFSKLSSKTEDNFAFKRFNVIEENGSSMSYGSTISLQYTENDEVKYLWVDMTNLSSARYQLKSVTAATRKSTFKICPTTGGQC